MSVTSQADGSVKPKGSATAGSSGSVTAEPEGPVRVELVHARWTHFLWFVSWAILAGFLAWKFGDVGKILGVMVGYFGVTALWEFAKTLLHAPGRIVVDEEVVLTSRLCSGREVKMPLADVRHAYLLRRYLPTNTAGPLLVVETKRGAFEYPRNWFATELEQRSIVTTVNRRLGRL